MNGPLLQGKQVHLRPIEPEQDARSWHEVFLDEEMHRWTGNKVPADVEEVRQMLQLYAEHEELIAWVLVESHATEQVIGTYWIVKPTFLDGKWIIPDEAQRLARRFWRKGPLREARQLVYDYAFSQLGVAEIHAHAWEGNTNSCRSMERNGFQLVDSAMRWFEKYQQEFCERHYKLTRDAWLLQKRVQK